MYRFWLLIFEISHVSYVLVLFFLLCIPENNKFGLILTLKITKKVPFWSPLFIFLLFLSLPWFQNIKILNKRTNIFFRSFGFNFFSCFVLETRSWARMWFFQDSWPTRIHQIPWNILIIVHCSFFLDSYKQLKSNCKGFLNILGFFFFY